MNMIKLNEPSFLPNLTLTGEMSFPEKGVLLITGDNGVGKSTLCAYLYAKKFLGESVIWTESNQFRSLYPITVSSILSIFLEEARDIDRTRYQELFSLFRMSTWCDRTWGELSSGQGQMLKLLMGLSCISAVYLLDEPAHFLDQERLNGLSQFVEELSKNALVIIVDHRIDWLKASVNTHYNLSLQAQNVQVVKV